MENNLRNHSPREECASFVIRNNDYSNSKNESKKQLFL